MLNDQSDGFSEEESVDHSTGTPCSPGTLSQGLGLQQSYETSAFRHTHINVSKYIKQSTYRFRHACLCSGTEP